jgi:predicted PurR-regulated permease PerM
MFDSAEGPRTYVQKVLIAVTICLVTLALLALLYFTFDVVLLLFAAILLAIFLRGLSDAVSRRLNIGDGWAVLFVSILLVAILGGAIALLTPSVAEQIGKLRVSLPQSAASVADYISHYGWGQAILSQLPNTQDVIDSLTSVGFLSGVGGIFTQTIGAVGNFLLVILLAIYLASEPRFYVTGFTKLFPPAVRPRAAEVLNDIGETLRWWLVGKAGSMLFIGILTWIGLSIIGVPLALTLGLLAGLLSFIPNFGPIISAIPAILLAFIESPITAVYVAGLYIGIQLIESNIVTPIIERETVELPPALTVIFQIALSIILGGLGLVLATPLLAVVMVLIQKVYIEGVLGDSDIEVNETLETEPESETAELESGDAED